MHLVAVDSLRRKIPIVAKTPTLILRRVPPLRLGPGRGLAGRNLPSPSSPAVVLAAVGEEERETEVMRSRPVLLGVAMVVVTEETAVVVGRRVRTRIRG